MKHPVIQQLDKHDIQYQGLDESLDWFVVLEDYQYDGDIVKAGTVTDFGSIPRPAWSITHPLEDTPGYLMHDDGYRRKEKSRYYYDRRLLRMQLRNDHVSNVAAYLVFFGTRSCGWYNWSRC